ncbi:hypothetical protein Ccrd_009576 [Cynara cardunculus var. scolymus]|uniref:Uncharacterized protein n=1 Tax=Cynara cardunculus var. scolymus TaxID=59895 RepID=A0A118K7C6_CYNCS|nr:hypothetical protein Ccrd_009576 [Cynara cardunculus var. scolymus]
MQRFQITKQSWRKRSMSATDLTGELPIYNPASAIGRNWSSRSVVKYNRIHLVPLVVMLCFFILWCFSSPVEMETKDGKTNFVPRTKKPPQESEATDVDLTVLALESPPNGFLSLSDEPNSSVAHHNQHNVSFLDSHDHNASLTDSHEPNASYLVSHEIQAPSSVSQDPSASFSDPHEPNELLSNLHELNASSSDSHDAKLLISVSQVSRISNLGRSIGAAPQPSGGG